jgi:hypothetical protein
LEAKLRSLLIEREVDSLLEEEDVLVKELMVKKQEFLRKEESIWRQKSRAVWIKGR